MNVSSLLFVIYITYIAAECRFVYCCQCVFMQSLENCQIQNTVSLCCKRTPPCLKQWIFIQTVDTKYQKSSLTIIQNCLVVSSWLDFIWSGLRSPVLKASLVLAAPPVRISVSLCFIESIHMDYFKPTGDWEENMAISWQYKQIHNSMVV